MRISALFSTRLPTGEFLKKSFRTLQRHSRPRAGTLSGTQAVPAPLEPSECDDSSASGAPLAVKRRGLQFIDQRRGHESLTISWNWVGLGARGVTSRGA